MSLFDNHRKLQPRYAALSFKVAALGCALGFVGLYLILQPLNVFWGIDGDECVRCQDNGSQWMLSFLVVLGGLIYFGNVVVAGIVSLLKLNSGELTASEALKYTFFSIYPKGWRKNA